MEKVLAEATYVLLLMLVINSRSCRKQISGLLLLMCHAESRIMLRQQDSMGKHFIIIIYIINFENTMLLASGSLFSLNENTISLSTIVPSNSAPSELEKQKNIRLANVCSLGGKTVSIRLGMKWATTFFSK